MADQDAFFEDHLVPEDSRSNVGVGSLIAGWAVAVIVFGALVFV